MILDIMPIPLSQGLYALVDGKNYERLNLHKWYTHKSGNTHYAVRSGQKNAHTGNQRHIRMHREILKVSKGLQTDHSNHCGLDNREQNIRICTGNENQHNRNIQKGTSKYKGVSWNKRDKRWRAQIQNNNREVYIGYFTNETKAAETYDKKAKELFGEFACLNFPETKPKGERNEFVVSTRLS